VWLVIVHSVTSEPILLPLVDLNHFARFRNVWVIRTDNIMIALPRRGAAISSSPSRGSAIIGDALGAISELAEPIEAMAVSELYISFVCARLASLYLTYPIQ
jgi:hypothetical protein